MEIRMRDEQLASVLQEEERLRERRHLQRVQQKQHHHRWRAEVAGSVTMGAAGVHNDVVVKTVERGSFC